jgi:hypothetical protein
VHLTGGILRHFRAFSTPEQNPALGVLSTPAHPQVTQTVGRRFSKGVVMQKYDDSDVFDERLLDCSFCGDKFFGSHPVGCG